MKCKAKKAFFAGKNDIYHRWKEVKKLNGKKQKPVLQQKTAVAQLPTLRLRSSGRRCRFLTCIPLKVIPLRCWTMS